MLTKGGVWKPNCIIINYIVRGTRHLNRTTIKITTLMLCFDTTAILEANRPIKIDLHSNDKILCLRKRIYFCIVVDCFDAEQ